MRQEYSDKVIERNRARAYDARNKEIADVVEGMEDLVKDGFSHKFNTYRYKIKNTKISIVGSFFIDNDTSHQGNTIDFLAYRYGMSFKVAVDYLTNEDDYKDSLDGFIAPKKKVKKIEGKKIDLERLKKDIDAYKFPEETMVKKKQNVMYYLLNNRKLDKKIVQWMIENRYIRQDERKNAVFVWYDKEGKPVGADVKGTSGMIMKTTGREFLSILSGSVNGMGFNLMKGKANNIKFFESPIDLISYLSLFKGEDKLKNTMFVSLGGLKDAVVRTFIELYPEASKDITFCLDNDDKAPLFIEKNFKDIEYKIEKSVTKDWNDDLKSR